MDRGPEHLLRELGAGVVRRNLLMQLGGRQAVVLDDPGAEILEAGKAELLGDLDDHGLGHAGIVRDGPSDVVSSRSRRPRIMSTTRPPRGVRCGIIIRMRGPTVLGSL